MEDNAHLVKTNLSAKVDLFVPDEQMMQCQYIAGIDEVGRGPLIGSVVTSAVILAPDHGITGLTDSKTISEKKRDALAEEIKEKAVAWTIAEASVEEIDKLNILHATMLAMKRALESLDIQAEYALIDGNRCPDVSVPCKAVVKGDLRVPVISAASILAKVFRDGQMKELDKEFPQYGLAQHKGYPTKAHLEALEQHGVTQYHRKTYGPVAKILAKDKGT